MKGLGNSSMSKGLIISSIILGVILIIIVIGAILSRFTGLDAIIDMYFVIAFVIPLLAVAEVGLVLFGMVFRATEYNNIKKENQ